MSHSKEEMIHASAVLVGEHAVLIRGASGSGKSQLAFKLLKAAQSGLLRFARLIADDRVKVLVANGRLVLSAPEQIIRLLEVNGLGIREFTSERMAVLGLVVDLDAPDAGRMPEAGAQMIEILGIRISRIPVAQGKDAFPLVLAALTTKQKV